MAERRRDRELEAGARAHFEDPEYYTHAYASRREDVAYYRRIGASRRSVLEYGVGNGRIAIALARAGVSVTGVDHSAPMLADLRRRLRAETDEVRERVVAVRGDMRRKRLGRRFELVICPFNGVLHLYTRVDIERWLARVHDHLAPRGELVFDVSMPSLEDLLRDPSRPYKTPQFVHPTAGRVRYDEYFDYDRARQILFVSMCFSPVGRGPEAAFMTPLAQRQFFPCELEALLHYGGFEVIEVSGDYHGGPLDRSSDVMVWRARPRRGRARARR